ncbi:MAG: GntR family transcriptional regulator [Treponema sp.]|jgi:DNA-binding transcriptional regulator YhcF (GntR family)|nr:GntR family transcriptional regulator [Treponema sp.]
MQITVDTSSKMPIYRQIVDQITEHIASGVMPPGYQLPTVRDFAVESGISHGTIKHAYDILELAGLIKKTRGSGTFVCDVKDADASSGSKNQALQAIDALVDKMQELSFSLKDIRILLDLKIREREHQIIQVQVAAVDCSPEALSVMCHQILQFPHTEVHEYLLANVLHMPKRFDPEVDIVVTTPTHYEELREKMSPGREPVRLVMAIAIDTALDLAAIPLETRLGVICASLRFAQVILRTCEEYCHLDNPIQVAYFENNSHISRLLQECDRLILPPNYTLFASSEEESLLNHYAENHTLIYYRYEIDRGSLLYLEEQIGHIYKEKG